MRKEFADWRRRLKRSLDSRAARRKRTRNTPRLEKLERRDLMTVDATLQILDFGLLQDTGESKSDQISANLTLIGRMEGTRDQMAAVVQFDHDGDQIVDGTVRLDGQADVFAYDPRDAAADLAQYSGPLTVAYRGLLLDPFGHEAWVGEWRAFSFTAEPPPAAPWRFDQLQLKRDTGSANDDGITTDPTIMGRVSRQQDQGVPGGLGGGSGGYGGGNGAPPGSGSGGSSGGQPGGFSNGGGSGGSTSGDGAIDSGDNSTVALKSLDDRRFVSDSELPALSAVEPLTRAAVEWDWNDDGSVDAQTWLSGSATFEFRPPGLNYGHHDVQARLLVWDNEYGVPLRTAWHELSFTFLAEPAADVAALGLESDTGEPDDFVTSDPTLVGRLAGTPDSVAAATVYFDVDGDELADGHTVTDGAGNFRWRPRGLAAGWHRVQAQATRWDALAEADVLGEWSSFEFTYEPLTPPAIASLELPAGDAWQTGPWILQGRLAEPIAGLTIAFDDDQDGVSDAVAQSDASGNFARRLAPRETGTYSVGVRTIGWDRLDGVDRTSAWQTLTFDVPAFERAGITLTAATLARDTGERNDDRVTSDPTLTGQVAITGPTSPSEHIVWVEIDRDGDEVVDDHMAVDESGGYSYRPWGVLPGPQAWQIRAAVWDENSQSTTRDAWREFVFTFAEDATPAPELLELGLLVDSGPDGGDRRTATSWITGRITDSSAAGDSLLEIDTTGDGRAEAFVVPDASGRFTYDVKPAAPGPVSIQARAARWATSEQAYVPGPWVAFSFMFEEPGHAPPTIVTAESVVPPIAPTISTSQRQLGWEATIKGRVANDGELAGLEVEYDLDGDGLVEGTVTTDQVGAFTISLSALPPGDTVVRVRATEAKLLTGETWRSEWYALSVAAPLLPPPVEQLPSAFAASARVEELRIAHDTGDSDSDRATSDPTLLGSISGAKRGQRRVEFDLDRDGHVDGFAITADDGQFEFRPEGLTEGLVAIAARLAAAEGLVSPWVKTQFVLSSDPDGAEAQRLAAAIVPYELAREEAVGRYFHALDDAGQTRYDAVAAAAQLRNVEHSQLVTGTTAELRSADERFQLAAAEAQQNYQHALQEAAQRFAQNIAAFAGDTTLAVMPNLSWPEPPAAGRLDPTGTAAQATPPTEPAATGVADTARWLPVERGPFYQQAHAASTGTLQAAQASDAAHWERWQTDLEQSLVTGSAAARRVWEHDVHKAERDYTSDLAAVHPSLDLAQETMKYQAAVQRAENTYAAALKFYDGQHFTEMARLYVKFQNDLLAAQWKYDSEMERLNNTQGGGEGDYYRTHLEWRRRIHWDFYTESAQAQRDYSEGVARAHQVKEIRYAKALTQRDLAIRSAETLYLGQRTEFDAWDQRRRIEAWQRLSGALATHQATYQETLAQLVQQFATQLAAGRRTFAESAADASLAHSERLAAALLAAIERRRSALPDFPELALAEDLAQHAADADRDLARLLHELDTREAAALLQRVVAEQSAESAQAVLAARATAQREQGYAASESARMRAILVAATAEARQELVVRFAFFRDLILARQDRDLARADARYAWDMQRAEIDFDHQAEVRDIRLDYMFHYHATPIEVPLAEARKRQTHRHAHAGHAYEQSIYNVEEAFSDRDVAENLEYELLAHGLHATRALAVADADRDSANTTQRATASYEVAVSDGETELRKALSAAEDTWLRLLARLQADRETGTVAIDHAQLMGETTARAAHRTRLASAHLQQVRQWQHEPFVDPAWSRYTAALAQADETRAIAQGAQELAWLADYTSAYEQFVGAREGFRVNLIDEQVTAYATMVDRVASSQRQLVRGYESEFLNAGDGGSTAAHQYYAQIIPADHAHLDRESQGEAQHEEAVRDADFDFRRSASDGRLARNLDAITDDELDAWLAASRQVQRSTEGAAFVQYARVSADSLETRAIAMARAETQYVGGWAGAAEQQTAGYVGAEQQAAFTQLAAWLTMQSDADSAESTFQLQLAAANTTFQFDVSQAGARRHLDVTRTEHTWHLDRELALRQWRLEQLEQHSQDKQHAWAFAETQGDAPAAALLRFQTDVARQDVYHAQTLRDAALRLMRERLTAELQLTDTLNQADLAWSAGRAAAEEQLTTRLSVTTEHYGRDRRLAFVNHVEQQIRGEGQAEQAAAAAQAQRQRAVARADEAFAIVVAGANKRWTIRAAEAKAALHVAGESADGLAGRDEESLTPAQRAYLAALRAADEAYVQEVQSAAIVRAGSFGDAWIELHAELGAAAQTHAATMAVADELLNSRSHAAKTAYVIMATDASRDYTTQVATTETDLLTAYESGRETWLQAMGNADLKYQHEAGAADVVLARETARAETAYQVAIASGDSSHAQARAAWLAALAPAYIQYREDQAYAGAYSQDLLTAASRQRDRAIAAAETRHARDTGTARVAHARATIGAFIDHQLTSLVVDFQLLDDAVKADGPRKIAYATHLTTHDVAVATAGKDLLIADAVSYPHGTSAAAEQAYFVAVADADRQFSIAKADADLQHRMLLIPAETQHAQSAVAAAAALHRAVSTAHTNFVMTTAAVAEQRVVAEATARARYANDETAAENAERWLLAVAETHWRSAQTQATHATLENLWSEQPTPWTEYRVGAALAESAWWSAAQHDYLTWVGARNQIEAAFTWSASQAFEWMMSDVARQDTQRIAAEAGADQGRTAQEADARTRYVQRLGNPATLSDRIQEQADHDYRVEVAQAEFERAIGGSQEAYERAVADAAARRAAAIAAGQRMYRQEEAVASAALRTDFSQAAAQQRAAVVSAATSWNSGVQATLGRFEQSIAEASAVRAQALAVLDADYQHQQAQSRELAFAEWATEHASPWALREHELRHAATARLAEQRPARQELSAARASTDRRFAIAEVVNSQTFLEQQLTARFQMEEHQAVATGALLAQQSTADGNLGSHGILPESDRWADLLPPVMNWLPGGSLLTGAMFQAGAFMLEFPLMNLLDMVRPKNGLLLDPQPDPFAVRPPAAGYLRRVPVPRVGGELQPAPRGPIPLPDRPPRPGEMDSAAMMRLGLMHMPPPGEVRTRSAVQWFLDDLDLMQRYPKESIYGAARGLRTSGKVLVNGTASTLKSFVTLGFASSPWELLEVTEEDRFHGYDAAFTIMRISQEFLVGRGAARLARPSGDPWMNAIGKGFFYWDVAQNSASTLRGGYGVAFGEGWTFGNSVELLGGVAGLSGNALGGFRHADEVVPKAADEILDHKIGYGVVLGNGKDKIGHVFLIFERPNGNRFAVGFYPDPTFDFDSTADRLKFIFGGNWFGAVAEIRSDTKSLRKALTNDPGWIKTMTYDVSERGFFAALQHVRETVRATRSLKQRYHMFSQCAVFGRETLQEIGIQPFVRGAYPPYIYFRFWLRDLLK